jgi:hypothetical protein
MDAGKKETGTTGGGSSSGGMVDPDMACGAEATGMACQACCRTNHMAAYTAFANALLTCACKAGNCMTECAATACAATPAAPSAACNTCLNTVQGTGCKPDLDTCNAGACKDFFTCAGTQCQGKN